MIAKDLTNKGPQAFLVKVVTGNDAELTAPPFPVTQLQASFNEGAPGTEPVATAKFLNAPESSPKPFCKRAPADGTLGKVICKGE
jgi:hypothetical protein